MDNLSNEYILNALRIADDLMELSNNDAGLADEGSFGILLGVMRDCSYKIRQHVASEAYELKTDKKFEYNSPIDYETLSNKAVGKDR